MKKIFMALALALIAGASFTLDAATSKEKLINSLFRQQKESEKQIVKYWIKNKRGKEMEQVLAEYVTREIRLQAMTGKMNTNTLLSKLSENGEAEYKTPLELARAIVVEHLKSQGIDIDKCAHVKGEYMIRKSCLE
jgi:ribosomal protein S4